jgi:hypothetical protein
MLGVRAQGHAARIRWLALQGGGGHGTGTRPRPPPARLAGVSGEEEKKQEIGRLTRGPHMAVIEGEG